MPERLHEDPGLQPERTALSWNRTALALLVCAATMLRWANSYPGIVVMLALVLIVLGLVIVVTNGRRYRQSASTLAQERQGPEILGVGLVTLCLVIIALSELGMMLITVG